MKLVSFNCTIEVSKDENGYSNNYYVTIDENGVSVSNPYTRMTPEQAIFATELIRDFIGMSMNYNARVDSFNHDMRLEQYAPQVATTVGYTITDTIGSTTKSIKLYSVVPGTTSWEKWDGTYSSKLIWNNGNFVINK